MRVWNAWKNNVNVTNLNVSPVRGVWFHKTLSQVCTFAHSECFSVSVYNGWTYMQNQSVLPLRKLFHYSVEVWNSWKYLYVSVWIHKMSIRKSRVSEGQQHWLKPIMEERFCCQCWIRGKSKPEDRERERQEILLTCSVFSTFLYLLYFLRDSLLNFNLLPAIFISLSFYYPTHPPFFLFLSFSFTLTFLLIYL